ncbi:hypothetical protein [Pinibacter aurantiacus]|uniref:Gliding motility-associated protein GldM C-terminal domain-containing protein n=1 Tax=Pinibacter aurantiacus TaxID=2851599 RepID=A0A9E2S943_9BACT|nr:hypothetical protein [Pinibacter aurantiacus]MBV4356889.1 hypothetical protein [Pinibacter aurantiacus]
MKLFLAYIILLFPLKTYSQVIIKNTSLVKPDTNALFYGPENMLAISGTSEKVALVSYRGNTIIAKGSNQFSVTTRNLKTDTLSVFSKKKLLLKKAFYIDTVFSITVHVGNILNDTATITEILANKGIKAVINCLYYRPYRIPGFFATFITSPSDTLAKNVWADGNLFSPEHQYYIKKLTKNSKIVLNDVRILFADSKARSIGPYFIFIK